LNFNIFFFLILIYIHSSDKRLAGISIDQLDF